MHSLTHRRCRAVTIRCTKLGHISNSVVRRWEPVAGEEEGRWKGILYSPMNTGFWLNRSWDSGRLTWMGSKEQVYGRTSCNLETHCGKLLKAEMFHFKAFHLQCILCSSKTVVSFQMRILSEGLKRPALSHMPIRGHTMLGRAWAHSKSDTISMMSPKVQRLQLGTVSAVWTRTLVM